MAASLQAQPACNVVHNGYFLLGTGSGSGDLSRNITLDGWQCSHGTPNGAVGPSSRGHGALNAWVSNTGTSGEGFYTYVNMVQGHRYALFLQFSISNYYSVNQLVTLQIRLRDNTNGFPGCSSGSSGPTPPLTGLMLYEEVGMGPVPPPQVTYEQQLRYRCFTYQGATGQFVLWVQPRPVNGYVTNITLEKIELVDLDDNPMSIVASEPDLRICKGDSVTLEDFSCHATGTRFHWENAATGAHLGTGQTLTVQPDATTTYRLVRTFDTCEDVASVTVEVDSLEADLGPDQTLCAGDTLVLDVTQPHVTYLWSTGATTPAIAVADSGTYWVHLRHTSGDCEASDTVHIGVTPKPQARLGPDQVLCAGESTRLTLPNDGTQYLWSTGATTSYLNLWQSGTYWVTATTPQGCEARDTIDVRIAEAPVVSWVTTDAR
ncbi:MAG: hypothetical protein KF690_06250, partial [Bacteroidetes bacterium]|nr:hypothetical protein [Bacteroidota bacterium]